MRNDIEGVDIGTVTEPEQRSDDESGGEDEVTVQPSGSRLNPDAPDFVPGVPNSLMAAKIIDDLAVYTRWSNAQDEISYGSRYDSIWRESSIQNQAEGIQPIAPMSYATDVSPANYIEIVGDMEQQQQQQQQKQLKQQKTQCEAEQGSTPKGRCCACALM